ncbi:MAG: dihydrofolate reductase [Prosthecobacter sp.]|jgi:dihydrofolate reductase|nr:dihydrofolate reductase [Prosthecobacter sp.]
MSARLTLIAAVSADGRISKGTGVPWDLPADREHFRAYARDRWLLIGRRTHEEMLGWFQPGHHPLVLTRDASFQAMLGQPVPTVARALELASQADQAELVCCGGAQTYAAAMPLADSLVITHVHDFLGDGPIFPTIAAETWEPVSRRKHEVDAQHAVSFEIVRYQRVCWAPLDLAA